MAQQMKQPEMGVLESTLSTTSGKRDMHMLLESTLPIIELKLWQ